MPIRTSDPWGRAAALPLFVLTLLAAGPALRAEPFVPTDDGMVLERLRDPADRTAAELRDLAERLRAAPGDRSLAVGLARRYIEVGRATGDPRYSGYAESVLAPWFAGVPMAPEVRLLRATLRQGWHDFDGALADLDLVLAERPGDPQALLTRATVLQVQGRPAEAAQSCLGLAGRVDPVVVAVCAGNAAAASGRALAAEETLAAVFDQAGDGLDAGLRVWAVTALAEIAELRGDATTAEARFREALALDGADIYLRAAHADLLLDLGRPGEVRAVVGEDTRPDALLLRLALAAHAVGEPDAAALAALLDDRFAASRLRGDARHRREEARFRLAIAGDAAGALALARDNWAVQREPWDARVLLEAALAARDPAAAAPVLAWMEETGTEHRRLAELAARLAGL